MKKVLSDGGLGVLLVNSSQSVGYILHQKVAELTVIKE